MSVLIKGMKMPEKCGSCGLFHVELPMHCTVVNGHKTCDLFHVELPMHCTVVNGHKTVGAPYGMPRPDWCPLVEIPEPHGEHLCEDEVVSCLEGADWINEVIRIFLDLQAEGSEDE